MRRSMIAMALVVCAAEQVQAEPVFWEGSGHYYDVISPGGITWQEAKAHAESLSYAEVPGHLATITSREENLWISETFAGNLDSLFMGAYQEENTDPAAGWHWVTDEPWEYTNWAFGEPNDNAGGEDIGLFWGDVGPDGKEWNDGAGAGEAYVIEYDLPADIRTYSETLSGIVWYSGTLELVYPDTPGTPVSDALWEVTWWLDGHLAGNGLHYRIEDSIFVPELRDPYHNSVRNRQIPISQDVIASIAADGEIVMELRDFTSNKWIIDSATLSYDYVVVVPEPTSIALLFTGAVGLLAWRRRRTSR